MSSKPSYVVFSNKKLEANFEKLKNGKSEDKQLYESITEAIDDIKNDHCWQSDWGLKAW